MLNIPTRKHKAVSYAGADFSGRRNGDVHSCHHPGRLRSHHRGGCRTAGLLPGGQEERSIRRIGSIGIKGAGFKACPFNMYVGETLAVSLGEGINPSPTDFTLTQSTQGEGETLPSLQAEGVAISAPSFEIASSRTLLAMTRRSYVTVSPLLLTKVREIW